MKTTKKQEIDKQVRDYLMRASGIWRSFDLQAKDTVEIAKMIQKEDSIRRCNREIKEAYKNGCEAGAKAMGDMWIEKMKLNK